RHHGAQGGGAASQAAGGRGRPPLEESAGARADRAAADARARRRGVREGGAGAGRYTREDTHAAVREPLAGRRPAPPGGGGTGAVPSRWAARVRRRTFGRVAPEGG